MKSVALVVQRRQLRSVRARLVLEQPRRGLRDEHERAVRHRRAIQRRPSAAIAREIDVTIVRRPARRAVHGMRARDRASASRPRRRVSRSALSPPCVHRVVAMRVPVVRPARLRPDRVWTRAASAARSRPNRPVTRHAYQPVRARRHLHRDDIDAPCRPRVPSRKRASGCISRAPCVRRPYCRRARYRGRCAACTDRRNRPRRTRARRPEGAT